MLEDNTYPYISDIMASQPLFRAYENHWFPLILGLID